MSVSRAIAVAVSVLIGCASLHGQVPVGEPDYGLSLISPRYFGPYAFPVPGLSDGSICSTLHLEAGADAVAGSLGGPDAPDFTQAATFRCSVPLWSDRATLSVWGEAHEWYSDSEDVRAARRVSDRYPLRGHDAGNVYFSLDMLLLRETQSRPSVALRAATQTATGDKYEVARHYDAPGYFFDLSTGKSFALGAQSSLKLSATAGFVCWQIDRGRQNDALLLGAKASLQSRIVSISAEYGQYTGRESRKGSSAGDCPRVLSARADVHLGRVTPFVCLQRGVHDWPFSLMRAGISYDLDIL